ncbi:MAG: GNAT family N-acetyltransferase [Ardenticatenaceae bacterium]|nr:GNAT family N-acetyltransferase [Ardenticatenaceae bacterium]
MNYESVEMVCHNLAQTPVYTLPTPYTLRMYQPGDGAHWTEIHVVADAYSHITPELFAEQFGTDEQVLAERQFYLLDGAKRPIGTATAWPGWDDTWGMVHWVAIRPEAQGKGLAKGLMTAVCQKFLSLGQQKAHLGTANVRLPALNLYRHFGFQPYLRTERDEQVWREVEPRLKEPIYWDMVLMRGDQS